MNFYGSTGKEIHEMEKLTFLQTQRLFILCKMDKRYDVFTGIRNDDGGLLIIYIMFVMWMSMYLVMLLLFFEKKKF